MSAPDPAPPAFLDAGSGEPLLPQAREAMLAALDLGYADPRRLHGPGRRAALVLENAREVVAEALGVRRGEVTFTPSGTHATHLGLLGLLTGAARGGAPVTTLASAVEHAAVLHAARWHARQAPGRPEPVILPVDRLGRLEPATLAGVLADGPPGSQVVAVQSANHEVGTLQPVAALAAVADLERAPLFTDACASAGRLPLPQGWAAAACSAHKWGGPAGVGVLLVRHGARWRAPYPTDDRGDERATGFENVAAALGAAAALQAVVGDREETTARQRGQVDRLRSVLARIPDTDVVGDPDERLPHLLTCSFLYVDGEALVTELDRLGLAVDSGSSCTASTLEPSHVLAAMGALTHGNVRIALARGTTDADVDRLLVGLPEVVARLRREAGAP